MAKRPLLPPPLKPGDCIGVMAPSSYVERADIEKSQQLLEARGYKVFIHPQTYARDNQSAGTAAQKAAAFHELWQRDDIKTVWMAGGGNRTLNVLPLLDDKILKSGQKSVMGFSDVTALLSNIHARTGLVTFHGPVFKSLHKIETAQLDQALSMLSGAMNDFPMDGTKVLKHGSAKGPLLGGCLSLFQYLAGTKDCADLNGAILFLEDAGDHLSRIDRMFIQLKRLGVFEKISGLILGEFIDMQDGARPFGFTLEDIVTEYTQDSEIPIVMNAPFGHGNRLYTLALGIEASLITNPAGLKFFET